MFIEVGVEPLPAGRNIRKPTYMHDEAWEALPELRKALGLEHVVQIAPLSASVSKILHMATLAAYEQDLLEAQA